MVQKSSLWWHWELIVPVFRNADLPFLVCLLFCWKEYCSDAGAVGAGLLGWVAAMQSQVISTNHYCFGRCRCDCLEDG